MGGDDLLTAKEATAILRVGWDTLDRWVKAGHLPYVQIGNGNRRYLRSDVEALLKPSVARQ